MSVASLADPEPASREPRVDPAGVPAPAIEVDHVDFSYGSALALRDVTLDIPRHEVMAFIGPSGCGKSTLLRCFNRMNDVIDNARVTGGQIRIDGRDINLRTVDAIRLRQEVGMVFQKSNPFPRSIFENVAYGLRIQGMRDKAEIEERVHWSLSVSALWDEVKDRLDTSAFGLSGGQQQRLCIARAIAVKPSIILMDEPCSALDPVATLKIEELITHLKEQFTIVIVTHNMQQATRCSDRTAFFFLGELIEHGPTTEIFSAPKNSKTEDYVSGRFG